MSFFDFFTSDRSVPPPQQAAAQTESVRKIVDTLDRLDPERARYLAAFAYILSRVARADLEVTPEETRAMERTVIEHGELSEDQAIIVVQIAKHQNLLFGATEDFLVTREFNKIGTQQQKLALLDCLFGVAAAEASISVAEDGRIRQIARELGLEHQDFIAVRSRYIDRLSVLRKNEGGQD
ncbi:MAG: TerB family tellurite resistance protein [Bryobacteraceae bacterium]